MKVETHNHPTAIAPDPGAATGSGGEIRDEGATGQGSKPKAGLDRLLGVQPAHPGARAALGEGLRQARAHRLGPGDHAGRALSVQPPSITSTDVPTCAATSVPTSRRSRLRRRRAARLPQAHHARRRPRQYPRRAHRQAGFPAGTPLVVLGGPAMLIGSGGRGAPPAWLRLFGRGPGFRLGPAGQPGDGAAMPGGDRRCWARGEDNPILFIHDVGAGGLSNALPELVHDAGRGGRFELRAGAQRRPGYVAHGDLVQRGPGALRAGGRRGAARRSSRRICERERCPYAVVGEATDEEHLLPRRCPFRRTPIDMPMSLLFGKPPRMLRDVERLASSDRPLVFYGVTWRRRPCGSCAADGGRQDLSDHHRRPQHHRSGGARSDGGSLAGAGGGRGGNHQSILPARRARPWPWVSAPRSR